MPLMHIDSSRFHRIKRISSPGGDNGALNAGIYLVRSVSSGNLYVEKRIRGRDINSGHAARETRALKACLSCPNIVDIIGVDSYIGSIYMSYCDQGALDGVIEQYRSRRKDIPEDFLWRVFLDISLALCYLLHGVNLDASDLDRGRPGRVEEDWNVIHHRDIKPGNIFLSAEPGRTYPRAVLGDFGCSLMLWDVGPHGTRCLTSRQAPAFAPPESPGYSNGGDVYQLGLVMHCLARLTQVPDYDTAFLRARPVPSREYSDRLACVVKGCLKRRPEERMRAGDLPIWVYEQRNRWRMGNGGRVRNPLPGWATEGRR
ncbi:kinase-like domain-containing protein [Clohesyomyces aquaticus]|uniref:non-specific serine/threonine protein kinase n=1 Tax=Clohesyomyces aquaticus TaxID=1231657 RepID=A0A1Y2A9L2_9PLEO|nr:kinase-like domain-containing protein [Clohesyomyces aquaticus]